MASAFVGASVASGAGIFAANPALGFVALVGAALFDQLVVTPALQGKGKQAAKAQKLLGVTADSNDPGAPRVWAIGRRVRVPTHTLWQDRKALEDVPSSSKRGTTTPQRRTYFDALIAFNDRPTYQLVQIRGNNTLLLFNSRNLVFTETSNMVVSVVGPRLVLTMSSTLDPDFTMKHKVGDVVQLRGFVVTGGVNINLDYWKVAAVNAHTSSPGSLELSPYTGQTVVGIAANAGTQFSPARVERVDDALFVESAIGIPAFGFELETTGHLGADDLLPPGYSQVVIKGFTDANGSIDSMTWFAKFVVGGDGVVRLFLESPNGPVFNTPVPNSVGGATNAGVIKFAYPKNYAAPYFPATFNPSLYYHSGTDDQGEDALIVAKRGTGNVSAYRGIAYQGFDDFFANDWGNALPYSMEAVIDPDLAMTWGEALHTVLRDRAGIPETAIDVEGINARPFLGAYFRGNVATATAIQPLLVAAQVVTQERDGTIALFEIENADVAQIENGATFSHMGARQEGEQASDDKITVEDATPEDLPTAVGIVHQDPDNQFADGYQSFGLRNPSGVTWENQAEFNLSNVVLSRKEARNLAATSLRRAHINGRSYRLNLTANYLHLLENDLITFTDDDGQEITARIIQRDIGSDFRVSVTALREDVSIAVAGSPVQSAAGSAPAFIGTPGSVSETVILDVPSVTDENAFIPSLTMALATTDSASWAGASVWESTDGTTYTQVGAIAEQAVVGEVSAPWFAAPASAEAYGSSVATWPGGSSGAMVEFVDTTIEFENATLAEVKAGTNWFAVISATDPNVFEIIGVLTFQNDGTPGRWPFDVCLRGLRGTTPRQFAIGDKVVCLSRKGGSAPVWRRQFPGQIAPQGLVYKFVPPGLTIDDVEPVGIGAKWRNALPLPVRSVAKTIGSSPYDTKFTVAAHWCRDVQEPGTQPPHPMDEPVEGYLFTIYDPTGSFVVRTKTLQANTATGSTTLRDKWVNYTAAEQTTDGYAPSGSTTFWLDVQQIGQFGLSPSRKQLL